MIKVTKENLMVVANTITDDSQIYGDEVITVVHHLAVLVKTAETYGCDIYGSVPNMWGSQVEVVASPTSYRHEWSF